MPSIPVSSALSSATVREKERFHISPSLLLLGPPLTSLSPSPVLLLLSHLSHPSSQLELHCESRTKSVWSYVMFHAASWTNPLFEEYPGPLWPATTQRNIKFWDRYFFRWEPEMHPRVTSGSPPPPPPSCPSLALCRG
jgi:hypothetical protein